MATDSIATLRAAGLLVTDWCPSRCRHCYVCAGPQRSAWMAVADARAHLAALARLGVPAEGVHIGGGEPFGDFDRLVAIVRAAQDAGLGGIGYVETSGVWATSEMVVRDRLATLAEAGMRQLSISADPYHQEFVPPDRVLRLHAVACEVLGTEGVRARRWKWLQQPEDVAAMKEDERLGLFARFLRQYPERMTGRAAAHLAPLLPHRPADDLPTDGCRALLESRHVHIDPHGWVVPGTCAGIALGRASADRPLDELLAGWRLAESPLIGRLVGGGPRALLEDAMRLGFAADPAGYAGACHLCWSIRRHLVRAGAGADELQPADLYAEPATPGY